MQPSQSWALGAAAKEVVDVTVFLGWERPSSCLQRRVEPVWPAWFLQEPEPCWTGWCEQVLGSWNKAWRAEVSSGGIR